MNEKEIFDMLENTDDENISWIAENTPEIDEKTAARILAASEKKLSRKTADDGEISGDRVQGVERYSRPRIMRIASAAASLLLLAGVIGAGTSLLRHNSAPGENDPTVPMVTTEAEGSTDEDESEPENSSLPEIATDTEYAELELHENTLRVYSEEKSLNLIKDAAERYKDLQDMPVIDTEPYISAILNDKDYDSLESKSYIYHMMLNSVDYFNTAEGSMIYGLTLGEPIYIDFKCDMTRSMAYERTVQGDTEQRIYSDIEKTITLNMQDLSCRTDMNAQRIKVIMSDNDRVVMLDNGELLSHLRNDDSQLQLAGNSCVFPQSYAMSRLYDFSQWKIVGTENICGRDCAVISGRYSMDFTMYTDLRTGIMLKYEEYSEDGSVSGYVETTSISVDQPVEIDTFERPENATKPTAADGTEYEEIAYQGFRDWLTLTELFDLDGSINTDQTDSFNITLEHNSTDTAQNVSETVTYARYTGKFTGIDEIKDFIDKTMISGKDIYESEISDDIYPGMTLSLEKAPRFCSYNGQLYCCLNSGSRSTMLERDINIPVGIIQFDSEHFSAEFGVKGFFEESASAPDGGTMVIMFNFTLVDGTWKRD
ncbi:MAG: hypothetical protein IJ874_03235 [Ruminococcus sp.]|nr:hypothetical protein [Ruminococcus sp.]